MQILLDHTCLSIYSLVMKVHLNGDKDMFTRGQTLITRVPVGAEDERICNMHVGQCAVFIEYTGPHGFARIAWYGDRKGLTYLMHPESLQSQSQSLPLTQPRSRP